MFEDRFETRAPIGLLLLTFGDELARVESDCALCAGSSC